MPMKTALIMTAAALLLMIGMFGCGTGDTGTVAPMHPLDVVMGETGTGGGLGGNQGGGGGGGATGACVVSGFACYENLAQGTCSLMSGVFSGGTSCASLGFTNCISSGGYTVCQ